jgi:hypothetical protein
LLALEVLCTGLGDGAAAGAVVGGASVGEAGAALLGGAAGAADACAVACVVGVGAAFGTLRAALCLALGRAEAVAVGSAEVGVVAGFTVVWLLAVWAGAVRANRTANAAAVIAPSWVARQVSLDSRCSPSARSRAAGS